MSETYICRNICDRTNHPKVRRVPTTEEAQNWCRATSEDFYGIWTWSPEDLAPSEYWVNGRRYKDARRASFLSAYVMRRIWLNGKRTGMLEIRVREIRQ